MYIETVRNFESAKLSLLKNTPIIQIIDHPIRPLFPKRAKAIEAAMVGFLISFLILVISIVLFLVVKTELKKLKHT